MTKELDLAKLEQIVEKLLQKFNVLKQEKGELVAQLQAKEERIIELQAQIDTLNDNKSEIQGRVSTLIDSIEEWESSFSSDGPEAPIAVKSTVNKKGKSEEHYESQLFSIGE